MMQPLLPLFMSLILHAILLSTTNSYTVPNTVAPPPISRATQLPNQIFQWRSHQIRYQVAEPSNGPSKGAAILIHGLFVNSDHWRYTLKGLADAGYTAYGIDLLGSGYSSKPNPADRRSIELVCGESRGRFGSSEGGGGIANDDGCLKDVPLGTASGGQRIASEVDLRHPLGSQYNFYTWAEQISDFTREIIVPSIPPSSSSSKVTLVSNSIGTISALQSVLDCPELYNGLFIVNPNFRELHSAEVPLSNIAMPIIRSVQSLLRSRGQGLFTALAKPDTVRKILEEPYFATDNLDDELVDVLLTPLLTPGASDVVFDTLSYSSGPLPEQQLADKKFPRAGSSENDGGCPVWICFGAEDPWTPPKRVEQMEQLDTVEKVVRLEGAGHCPHDEVPELVNPLIVKFMERVR